MMTDDDGSATVQPDLHSSPTTGLLINFDEEVGSTVSVQASNVQDYR